jgi:hypothetical protein
MSADQDIDAIDLVEGEPVDRPAPLRGSDLVGALDAEALRRESDAPRLSQRELLHLSSPRTAAMLKKFDFGVTGRSDRRAAGIREAAKPR